MSYKYCFISHFAMLLSQFISNIIFFTTYLFIKLTVQLLIKFSKRSKTVLLKFAHFLAFNGITIRTGLLWEKKSQIRISKKELDQCASF